MHFAASRDGLRLPKAAPWGTESGAARGDAHQEAAQRWGAPHWLEDPA
jgi:hypothetical protein